MNEVNPKTFVESEDMWPHWPFLPVKSKVVERVTGLIISGQGSKVFMANLFAIGKVNFQQVGRVEYSDIDSLLESWEID